MTPRLPISRPTVVRLLAVLLAVLLFTGAQWPRRVLAAISAPVIPVLPGQPPTEEEERHAPHDASKAATPNRRHATRVPGLAPSGTIPLRSVASAKFRPSSIARPVRPDHESDYRNGIGAPLRC